MILKAKKENFPVKYLNDRRTITSVFKLSEVQKEKQNWIDC